MVKITGVSVNAARIKDLTSPETARLLNQALLTAGDMIKTDAQISITEGAVSGKFHVPSKPGEPPNNDTGVLANNIEVDTPAPLKVRVSSNAPYAKFLELGTSRMSRRPYMAPATEKNRADIVKLLERVISRVIAKG